MAIDPAASAAPGPGSEPQTTAAQTLSAIFAGLGHGAPEERLTLADLRRQLGERGFGLMILVLAIPNCLPIAVVPGFSVVTGAGLVFFTLQLCLDKPEPYLPGWLMRREFTRGSLASVAAKADPFLRWVERLVAPRLGGLVTGTGERVLGAVALLLSITLLLPIPFANFLPAAAITLFALALISRDGVLSILGYAVAAATAFFLPTLFAGAVQLAQQLAAQYL
jgi:hypothetical protein